jgi:hypothetical protein
MWQPDALGSAPGRRTAARGNAGAGRYGRREGDLLRQGAGSVSGGPRMGFRSAGGPGASFIIQFAGDGWGWSHHRFDPVCSSSACVARRAVN